MFSLSFWVAYLKDRASTSLRLSPALGKQSKVSEHAIIVTVCYRPTYLCCQELDRKIGAELHEKAANSLGSMRTLSCILLIAATMNRIPATFVPTDNAGWQFPCNLPEKQFKVV